MRYAVSHENRSKTNWRAVSASRPQQHGCKVELERQMIRARRKFRRHLHAHALHEIAHMKRAESPWYMPSAENGDGSGPFDHVVYNDLPALPIPAAPVKWRAANSRFVVRRRREQRLSLAGGKELKRAAAADAGYRVGRLAERVVVLRCAERLPRKSDHSGPSTSCFHCLARRARNTSTAP